MRILSFTAGAANMICGTCLRDNALAAELMRQGHDVVLMPIYTPTWTDEPNVSQRRVLFGGISVYLQQHSALFRHTPWLLDKLWDSPAVLRLASRKQIKREPQFLGEMTVSVLQGENGPLRKEFRKLAAWVQSEPPFDAISLPFTLVISFASVLKPITRAPICCTLQGEDLFLEGLSEPYRSQAIELISKNAIHVDAFTAVSEYYAEYMCRYLRIPEEKVHVVPLGINLAGHSGARRPHGDTFHVGYLARIAPEKGLHLLCEAYRRLRQRPGLPPSKLLVAGWLGHEFASYLDGLRRQMTEWGLGDHFVYEGTLDRDQKIRFIQNLDVLSVPTIYADPKGTFVLEAMANGVPVVQPRCGAFPEMIERTGGGILVEQDDPDSLAEGIWSIWSNPGLALELGSNGVRGVREHYSVRHMALRMLEVLSRMRTAARRAAG